MSNTKTNLVEEELSSRRRIDLSVIILSYNTKELLRKCLESVFEGLEGREGLEGKAEVIVVDNASTDGSIEEAQSLKFPPKADRPMAEKVKNYGSKLKIIRSKKNLGFSGGNNLALRQAQGKYILFLNSDTEVMLGAFKESIKFMEENPQVGAMTPKTMLFSGKMDPDCHRGFPTPWASFCYFSGLENLFPKSRLFGQYHKFYLDLNENHEIDAGFGTFMIVRKEVLDKVGWWDENYFFYGEDLDLFYRIKKAGWRVMFYAKPVVLHHKGASSGLRKESKGVSQPDRTIKIKTAKASVRAMEIFYRKFYKDKYPFWLTFLIISAIRIKGLFRLLYHYLT